MGPELDGSRSKREWEKREIDNSFKEFCCRGNRMVGEAKEPRNNNMRKKSSMSVC